MLTQLVETVPTKKGLNTSWVGHAKKRTNSAAMAGVGAIAGPDTAATIAGTVEVIRVLLGTTGASIADAAVVVAAVVTAGFGAGVARAAAGEMAVVDEVVLVAVEDARTEP